MRVLVVYCHPVPDSFGAAVRDAVLRGLARAGHEAELLDLYDAGFNPVMSEAERRAYHSEGSNIAPVADELVRLRRAEGLVFVYPTWWYGPPAMLKGWLDRVLVPHETFGMPGPLRMLERRLTNIRVLAAVSTLGSPWLWWLWMGQPGRRILLSGVGEIVHPRARRLWMALHSMDSASPSRRAGFLARVETRFSRLRTK
ncbi:NAD(P)H-dependent oxidoreductase [Ancylobacter sp. A5.8]|uniref:NAD(P)H-dependent oxidoreductase n=1 Tax=Ancylobacter gelatini TaxID=2919920 RepID=UPI001F4D53CF|nr:NAD(P)H-dependent oxidoreductase [Ancylobacter gelatini]MCJ8144832.1 NAD(P)H-dependent oxidoreductase [Ancylobacter gelatini]